MSEEGPALDYHEMRIAAAKMVAAIYEKRDILNAPEATAVLERLVAGEDVPLEEVSRAYTVVEIAAHAVLAVQRTRL